MEQPRVLYADPPDLREHGEPDLYDPFERTAIAVYLLRFMTPDEARWLLERNDPTLRSCWVGPGVTEADRTLARKRAAVVLAAYGIAETELAA